MGWRVMVSVQIFDEWKRSKSKSNFDVICLSLHSNHCSPKMWGCFKARCSWIYVELLQTGVDPLGGILRWDSVRRSPMMLNEHVIHVCILCMYVLNVLSFRATMAAWNTFSQQPKRAGEVKAQQGLKPESCAGNRWQWWEWVGRASAHVDALLG